MDIMTFNKHSCSCYAGNDMDEIEIKVEPGGFDHEDVMVAGSYKAHNCYAIMLMDNGDLIRWQNRKYHRKYPKEFSELVRRVELEMETYKKLQDL